MKTQISEKKQILIDEYSNSPLNIDEMVYVHHNDISPLKLNKDKIVHCKVISINGDIVSLKNINQSSSEIFTFNKTQIKITKNLFNVGVNPFFEKFNTIRPINYTLESIIHNINLINDGGDNYTTKNNTSVKEVNWNPFVLGKDKKAYYYQRNFVWTREQNQLLIESIYRNINCGVILIRLRGFEEIDMLESLGIKDLAFKDIVDGKQRLNAIRGFILNEYFDYHGNYFADLSAKAQRKFISHQLFQYAELSENTSDEEVLYQFLKTNHSGVSQSKEHIDFVSSLLKNI